MATDPEGSVAIVVGRGRAVSWVPCQLGARLVVVRRVLVDGHIALVTPLLVISGQTKLDASFQRPLS